MHDLNGVAWGFQCLLSGGLALSAWGAARWVARPDHRLPDGLLPLRGRWLRFLLLGVATLAISRFLYVFSMLWDPQL